MKTRLEKLLTWLAVGEEKAYKKGLWELDALTFASKYALAKMSLPITQKNINKLNNVMLQGKFYMEFYPE